MFKRLLVIASIGALIASAMPSGAARTLHRTETQTYVGSWDPVSPTNCEENEDFGMGIGMVCYEVKAADVSMDIEVKDLVNPNTGFFYFIADSNGDCAEPGAPGPTGEPACESAGFGCPTVTNIPFPSGSRQMFVWPSGIVLGPTVCTVVAGVTSHGAGSTGEVIVKFFR